MAFGEKAPMQSPSSTYFSDAPAANYGKLLGWKYSINGNDYKVVKATAAFTAAQIAGLVCLDAGTTAKNNFVAAVAGAAAIKSTIAGIASPSQIALNIGDYFLVQTAGRATVTTGTATTANTPQICGAAGVVTDAGAISLAVWSEIIGIAHQTRTTGQTGELEMEYIA